MVEENVSSSATSEQPSDPPGASNYVHRLVQDEKAKTILLNVPLEVSVDAKPPRRPPSSPSSRGSTDAEVRRAKTRSMNLLVGKSAPRVRSASVGRDKKSEIQARYWAFLFENLRRAVDDLYRTSEGDESIPAAKEVILVLENYVRDFKNLVNWLKLKFEYENTPPPQRPTSLAWEVRKTSPAASGKLTPTSIYLTQRLLMATPAKRMLNFDEETGHSVADTIKEVEVTSEKKVGDGKSGGEKVEKADKPERQDKSEKQEKQEKVEKQEKSEKVEKVEKKEEVSEKSEKKKSPETVQATKTADEDPSSKESQKSSSKPNPTRPCTAPVPQAARTTKPVRPSTANPPTTASTSTYSSKVKHYAMGTVRSAARSTSTTTAAAKTSSSPKLPRSSMSKSLTSDALAAPRRSGKDSESPKNQHRVSLVARQSRVVSVGPHRQQKTVSRSNTSLGINSTAGRDLQLRLRGVTSKIAPMIRARPSSSNAPTSTKPTTPLPPFGSTSSISSAGSTRSWADTVKGLKAPKSVEEVNRVDEEAGWETVRPRTRSRYSPANRVKEDRKLSKSTVNLKQPLKKRASVESGTTVKHSAKTRFSLPSSAMSMPSLALDRTEEVEEASEEPPKKPFVRNAKSSSSITRKERQKTPNLERVAEMRSNASSAESLSEGDQVRKIKKKKDMLNRSKQKSMQTNPEGKKKELQSSKSLDTISPRKDDETKDLSLPLTEDTVRRHNESLGSSDLQLDGDGESTENTEEEIARKEEAIAMAQREEDDLAREIRETEFAELTDTDGDPSADDTDQKSEISEATNYPASPPSSAPITPGKYDNMMDGLSWADQIELEEQLYDARYPGRVIQLHEKLSSPARKREPHEAFKHHQEKQLKARIRREKFQEEKAQKLSALNAKIQEVIATKEQLIDERRDMIECKMKKAEAKRLEHIELIRRKAHEEEEKLKEIAFINKLEAENMRKGMLDQNQVADEKCEERLAEIAEERAKKAEQREAKEARAEKRRQALEEKRMKDVEALKEKIRSREERIKEEQEQMKKERRDAAREKARDREEKLSSVRAAEKDMQVELQGKIQQKQEDAAKRHKEKLEYVRLRAFELSVQRCSTDDGVPILEPYDPKKKCELCNVLIDNEVHLQSHLRGKRHCEMMTERNGGRAMTGEEVQHCNVKCIVDAAADEQDPKTLQRKERAKGMKKRAKKIKARMIQRAADYETKLPVPSTKFDAPNRAKIGKSLRDIEKLMGSQGKGAWPNNSVSALERALGEICRAFEKNVKQDQAGFYALGGYATLAKIINVVADQKTSCVIPLKSIVSCCKTWSLACRKHKANTEFVLLNNTLTVLVDVLYDRLATLIPERSNDDGDMPRIDDGLLVDPVAKAVMTSLALCLEDLSTILQDTNPKPVDQSTPTDLNVRVQDQASYIISIGIVDKLATYLHNVRDPIDNKPDVGDFLLSSLQFLSALTGVVEVLVKPPTAAPPTDPTHLLQTLQLTDLAGTVSMLYGMLLHQDAPSRSPDQTPPRLPSYTLAVTSATAELLHRMVRQHLSMVQTVLGSEGISLEFRHIASYLLWYCQHHHVPGLLHLTIILVGFFAARHTDNQVIVQSGHQPSVLQQLCNLPFPYFSQPELKAVLFPTLLACCHDNAENKAILTEEMSWNLIEDFLKSDDGKTNHLVQLVLSQ